VFLLEPGIKYNISVTVHDTSVNTYNKTYSMGHYPNTALFNNPPKKIPWLGSGLSS